MVLFCVQTPSNPFGNNWLIFRSGKQFNMKINNETKVGILTIVALGLLIIGFNYLKGKDVFNHSKKIYAIFSNLGALEKSNDVKINGLSVGKVYETEATDKDVTGIKVTISLTRDVNIPVNSVAYITAPLGGLASASIVIEKGDAAEFLKNGDTINTRTDADLLTDLSSAVTPTLAKIRQSLDSLNKVFGNVNTLFNAETKGNLHETIANLDKISSSLNKLLDTDNGSLAKSLNNINSITDNLKKNNDSISSIISNTKQFTQKLSSLDIKQIADSLQSTITLLKATAQKISSPEGTIGSLINDNKLYNKLNDVILSAEILLDDIRAHPKRYVNISVFGKKDKGGALTSPLQKDTLPR